MPTSRSNALATSSPVGAGAYRCHDEKPDANCRRDGDALNQPSMLDLRDPSGFAQLARMDLIWPVLSATRRRAWLDSLEIILPPRALIAAEIALLPGGAVTLRKAGSILVSDPADAVTFNAAETKRLRRALGARQDVSTLSHAPKGIVLHPSVPKTLPPQALTIVPDTVRSPLRGIRPGPALVQWGVRGAVAWPLVEAPASFALIASIAAAPFSNGGSGLVSRGSAIATETWLAEDADARCHLIAPALADHIADLLAGTISEALLSALTDACVEGPNCLARRVADGLAILPSCFLEDHNATPGTPPSGWRAAMTAPRDADGDVALLGLDDLATPFATIRALREILGDADVLGFAADGDKMVGCAVPLSSDAAMFLARKVGPRGRLGLLIPTPALPVDLYALAHDVAAATGARTIAVAPCWGFCHRVGPDGVETGNAGWFGMGAGLDEADMLIADFASCA